MGILPPTHISDTTRGREGLTGFPRLRHRPGRKAPFRLASLWRPCGTDIILTCLTAPLGAGNVMKQAAPFPVLRIRDQPSLDRCEKVGQPPEEAPLHS